MVSDQYSVSAHTLSLDIYMYENYTAKMKNQKVIYSSPGWVFSQNPNTVNEMMNDAQAPVEDMCCHASTAASDR